jgi:hypothetical protein
VVFAAFALVGAPGFSLSASLFALAGFLVGAYFGGALISRLGHDRGLLLRAGGAAELACAAVALVVAATSGDPGVGHAGHAPRSQLARVPGRETLSTSRCYPHTSIPTPRPRCAR